DSHAASAHAARGAAMTADLKDTPIPPNAINEQHGSRSKQKNWRHRATVELTNALVHAKVLPGGGHIAEFRFVAGDGPSGGNVLWEAPWSTYDPGTPEFESFDAAQSDLGTRRFLATYTGHALCLDGFGPAPAEDVALGAALHGEASVTTWVFNLSSDSSAKCVANLPLAKLRVQRDISLLPNETVLRVDERITNESESEHRVHWVQHATVGAPIFQKYKARVTSSVEQGRTWPDDYEGENLLKQDAGFDWPHAPREDHGMADLRELFAEAGKGFVAAAHQPLTREHGFVAVSDADAGLTMGYVFRADVFPWVTFWEENCVRQEVPWCGTVQARGLEFGTTPFPLGNATVDANGPVLGYPSSCKLAAHQTMRAPWVLFLAKAPHGATQVDDVRVLSDEIVLVLGSQSLRLPASGIEQFLSNSDVPTGDAA
ncbi:MAG: hypothetical protein ABI142_14415, partial [Bryocella sp.]